MGVAVVGLAVVAGAWWAGGLVSSVGEPVATPEGVSIQDPAVEGARLRVPAVGLDVELLAMMVGPGLVVDPPSHDAAFVLADHGVPPSRAAEGTVFVAMHAVNAGTAAGNALVDPAARTVLVSPGDVLEVDGVRFEVVETAVVGKTSVARDAGLWDPGAQGRVVVVTCMPVAGRAIARENVVVVGRLPITE